MIKFVDGTVDPFLWFLADWSIRWGVLIVGLAIWFRARPPRRAAARHLFCATALATGLILPLAPRWAAPWALPSPEPVLARVQPVRDAPAAPIASPAILTSVRESAPPTVSAPISTPVETNRRPAAVSMTIEPAQPLPEATAPALEPWQWARLGLAAAWIVGALVALAQLAAGHGILARLRSSSRPIAAARLASYRAAQLGAGSPSSRLIRPSARRSWSAAWPR